ncbi:MAG: sigma-70 family RNA polymerase sigma factor [Pseudomonadota bacterium]
MIEAPESQIQDRELIQGAQSGDSRSFEELYRRNIGRIHGLCIRMTANEALAADCAQQAFIQAWKKLGSFEGRSSFSTWLHRIAVNEVLSFKRREKRQQHHLEVIATDMENDPPKMTAGDGDDVDLNAAINTLPEGARHVFVLHMIHGYQHDEVADMLGVAVGTCKAQLHRAKRLLRQRLEQ